jgi:hypothetical protein
VPAPAPEHDAVGKACQTLTELLPAWLEFTPRREEVDRDISRIRGNESLLASRLAGQRDTDPPEELRWTKDFQERVTHESALRRQMEARRREYEEATGKLQEAGPTICRYARQNGIDPTPLKRLLELRDVTAAPDAQLVLSSVIDALSAPALRVPVPPVEASPAPASTDRLDRFADPTRCPECDAPVPELYREQSSYVCQACGRWRRKPWIEEARKAARAEHGADPQRERLAPALPPVPAAPPTGEAPPATAPTPPAGPEGTPADPPRPRAAPGKPSQDRQDDIVAAIVAKGTPLTRPELVEAMKLKTEGKLGAHLAWMVNQKILKQIPARGYWPADRPVPE